MSIFDKIAFHKTYLAVSFDNNVCVAYIYNVSDAIFAMTGHEVTFAISSAGCATRRLAKRQSLLSDI